MNWIVLSPPPLSSDPDNPQNLERALGMLIIVAGGGSCDKFRAASCNSMFPLFSFIRGTNDVHGDPLALHNTWKEGSIPFWCFFWHMYRG